MAITLYELTGSDGKRPFSPHCWKTVMALAHKGLEWNGVATPFTKIPDVEGGAKIVPTIRDGDHVIADSFQIALYLEDAYPERPTLFRGDGGKAMARFVESWSQTQLHSVLGMASIMDIHDCVEPADQAYIRQSREKRFGMTLEEARERGQSQLETLPARLEPLRTMLKAQPFIGGEAPLFADYIVFGAFQWVRIVRPQPVLENDDPVSEWFERCLSLHDGVARAVPAAA